MYSPSLEEMKALDHQGYRQIPLKKEIYSDFFTPIMVLKKCKAVTDHCFILESHEQSSTWGRYSFIGYDPKHEVTCNNGRLTVDGIDKGRKNPTKFLREVMQRHKTMKLSGFPTFTGGFVGFFAYDYLKYSEPTVTFGNSSNAHFKDVDLMYFDECICFDHERQKIMIIVNVDADHIESDYPKKCQRIEEIERMIKMDYMDMSDPLRLKGPFMPMFSKEEYCAKVEEVKHHIVEGDIFQAVLANRIEAKCSGSLLDTYRVLRTTNPSPYMFYFYSSSLEVAGASPETMVKLSGDTLYTFPIAGSRPRGKTEAEDQALEEELKHDEKELAEHNMLVDLGRNDLGKICQIGSVKVHKYKEIMKFSKIMHIASEVQGTIKEGEDALSAIETMLPAGTLSGAPKIKACSIIGELEKVKRGIYGGAIGYLDFTGNMDTCIGIRLAYKKSNKVYICSGAGIVYDSKPENEYQECLNKAAAVIEALKIANGGIDV
ncbi:MAG TPA: anthranilate synthase component I [Erysipelotrichaceae bacterium]|nr:anthranilate synthase component I [Erysipelotrichaceae bacterium]